MLRMFLMGVLDRLRLLEPARDLYNRFRYLLSFRTRRENRGFLRAGAPDGLPVPPPSLTHYVGGSFNQRDFYMSGLQGSGCIRGILEKNGIRMETLPSILDFGCGCGRIVRFWAGLKGTKVCGTDYNPLLAGWCRDNLLFGEFSVNGLARRLDYSDGRFAFVYAVSVFTHLPDELQRFWLDELVRVTAPGGHLYLTVLGTCHRDKMSAAEWEAFGRGEMIVQWEGYPGTNICRVFHSEHYVRERLLREGGGSRVEVVDFVPGGAVDADRQDVFLLRKT